MAETQINVGMNVDGVVAGTEKAKRKISELGGAARDAGTEASKGMATFGNGGEAAAKKVENATNKTINSIQRQIAALEAGDKSSRKYQESLARMRGIDTAALKPYLDQLDAMKAKQADAVSSIKSMDSVGTGLKATFASVAAGVAGITAALASITGMSGKLISVQREFDILNSSLTTVTGSSAKAAQEFEWIKRFAATTPYQLNEVTQGFVKMKALGLDGSEASLKSYGNTASAMGKGLNQMIEAVADAATGEFERLKEFGIKARKSGDDVSLTFQGITKTIGNNAAEITSYLKSLGEVEFAGAMEERAKTLDGVISNLADNWEALFRTVNQGGFAEAVTNDVRTLNTALQGLTDTMLNSQKAGDGMIKQFANAAGFAVGTAAVGTLNTAFNGFNWTVNALTGGFFNLNENVKLLPESLMTNEQRAVALSGKLQDAEADLSKLQKQLAIVPDNIYLKSSTHQAFLLVQQLRAAKEAQDNLARPSQVSQSEKRINAQNAYAAEQEKTQQRVTDLLTKSSGVSAEYIKRMKEIGELNASGALSADQLAKALDGAQALLKKNATGQGEAKKALSEHNKELAIQAGLLLELSGYSSTYTDDVQRLVAMREKGTLTEEAYVRAVSEMVAKQPGMVANLKAEAEAQKELNKALGEFANTNTKALSSAQDEVAKAQASYDAHGKLASVLQEEALARLENWRIITAMGGEDTGVIDAQIAAKKELIQILRNGEVRDASEKAAKDMMADQKKAAEESGQFWEDALMRAFESGKGFFQSLWDTIKNTLKTQVLKVLVSATGLTSMSMAGATDLAGGGGGNLLGTAANLGKMYDTITGGFTKLTATVSGNLQYAADYMMTSSSDMVASLGESLSANVGTLSTATGYLGGIAAGLAAGKMISGGYAVGGGSGNTAVNAGTAIGAVVGGPIGAAIGGAIGGLVNRAFGRKATEMLSSGTRGTFSSEEFSGVNYANMQQKGGWFRSDKNWTDITAMATETRDAWSYAFAGVKGSVTGMAASLGLATEQITAYSKYVDVAAGTTEAQITALFTGMADDMARAAAPGIAEFANTGETASVTMARLATSLQTANMWLAALDQTLFGISLVGGDAASKLADAFGGLENMANASKTYYDLFWTEAERLADTGSNVAKGLALVGVAMPNTKDAFRDVVSALDLTTDAGRNTYAVMLALAPEFAQVADGIAASVNTLFDSIEKRMTELQQSIASERESVAGARAGILLAAPKTASQLAAEIAATKVAMPTDEGVISAMAARTAAQAGVAAAQSAQSATGSVYGTALSSAQAGLNSTVDKYKNLAAYFQNMAVSFNGYQIKVNATGTNNDAFGYNAGTNQLNPWNSTTDATQTGRAYRHFIGDTAAFTAAMTSNGTLGALQGGNADLANSAAAVATAQAAYNSAMTAATGTLNTATAAKNAADAAAKQAVLDYAAAMTQYSGDAEKAVKVLSTLREETVAYYEAQKELAGLLIASAANLREAVRATRFSQLDEQAGLAQQQSSFAQNYSLALSTTGVTKAGYADQLGAALLGLSTALMDASATRADWALATSSLFAQSDTIAAQLEAEAGAMNYQADSLALLDSIDVSLMELDTNTAILKNAIDGGASSTAAGLRAIVTQLGGVPSFDVGTNYVPRDMFARVHQGEAIVPRAFNPASMGQGGATAEMVQELRALRTEVAGLRSEAAATAGHTSKTARLLDRAMPDGDALATRVAV